MLDLNGSDKIGAIVIDEAHCFIKWGKDFRPCYLELKQLKAIFPNVPILALTATASPVMQVEIAEKLSMKNEKVVSASPDRPNIKFVVKRRPPLSGGNNTSENSVDSVVRPLINELQANPEAFEKTVVFSKIKWCGYCHEEAIRPTPEGYDFGLEQYVAQYHAPCTSKVKVTCNFVIAIASHQ